MASTNIINPITKSLYIYVSQSNSFSELESIKYNTSTGLWELAQADSKDNLAEAIVLNPTSSGFKAAFKGVFYTSSTHGKTLGSQYYLDASTAGANTITAPTIKQGLFMPFAASIVYIDLWNNAINGVPSGGGERSLLMKNSTSDYDFSWVEKSFMERDSGTSRGSTNTTILIHSNLVQSINTGVHYTYTNSATDGGYYTIITPGYYYFQYIHRAGTHSSAIKKNTTLNNSFNYTSDTDIYAGGNTNSVTSSSAFLNCAEDDLVWFVSNANGTVPALCKTIVIGPF